MKLLNVKEVAEMLGVSTSWVFRHMRQGTFPKSIKIGPKTSRWKRKDIADFMRRRQQEQEKL